MGFIDKIKNALFEVEYVEVEEPPKKEKKVREEKEEKPIAKKVVLPGKKEDKVEELQEEELKDEDFEIRPKDEPLKARTREEFKIMNDNDFKMDEDIDVSEPEIVQVLEENIEELSPEPEKEEEREVYVDRVETSYRDPEPVTRESKPYGVDNSYSVPIHPYGTYEKREEKTYFRPSPIISPIYGILDKNYKKEDVKEKREVHISSYTRNNVSVDDIRNKAYGRKSESLEQETKEEEPPKFEKQEEEEENVLVDLSDRAKPEVKEITMGDAVEYFQDLGLEYNVDYVDTSTDRNTVKKEEVQPEKTVKEEVEKPKEEELELTKDLENTMELSSNEEEKATPEEVHKETREEVRKKKEDTVGDDTNDNLFDLIDSMYQENE